MVHSCRGHLSAGLLKIFPAKEGGLTRTFPHQNYNSIGNSSVPWRNGDLCLSATVHLLGRQRIDPEPTSAGRRLRWHVERAIAWLRAAANRELLQPGDPFELPQFPLSTYDRFMVFNECPATLCEWNTVADRSGLVNLGLFREHPTGYVVRGFSSTSLHQIVTPIWGSLLSGRMECEELGIWLLLEDIPVLEPWQAPMTWGELRDVCAVQGVDLNQLVQPLVSHIRDGKAHLALIGFPIPAIVGAPTTQIHWQAMEMPIVSFGSKKVDGFRANETGYRERDRRLVFQPDRLITWVDSQNWHQDQLATRGRLPTELSSLRIGILGAGAVGSALASLLVRAGAHDLVIVDSDQLEGGNLVRHTLGFLTVRESKATALAHELNRASPHANVSAIDARFPDILAVDRSRFDGCGLIIDCTADDDVLYALEEFPWPEERIFCSVSLALRAQRLFCFLAHSSSFPRGTFERAMEPWFDKGRDEFASDELPWEGVGCWHPVFPARVDSIWMLVAGLVEVLSEPKRLRNMTSPELIVLEKYIQDDYFGGIRLVPAAGVA